MFKALPPAFMGEKLKVEATLGNKQLKGYSLHKPQDCICDPLWSIYNRSNLLVVFFSVGPTGWFEMLQKVMKESTISIILNVLCQSLHLYWKEEGPQMRTAAGKFLLFRCQGLSFP